jgi:hypothetical protein
MLFYAVPYVVMESGYTFMASVLPIREHIDMLTPQVFFDKLLLHPLGPYWFLHTLIISGMTYWAVEHVLNKLHVVARYVTMGLVLYGLGQLTVLSFGLALYFLIGIIIRRSSIPFLAFFKSTWIALPALALLALNPLYHQTGTVGALLIVWLVVSSCLTVYPFIGGKLRATVLFLGRNTLPLFLFSPIFTILCKNLVGPLSFDPTKMLFLLLSLAICITGSLAVSRLIDACRLSPFFFGKEKSVK